MSDALDYDKHVLDQLRHIEDINLKFALQNYAAAGATFLAYFGTTKLPLWVTVVVVVGLAVVFNVAIWLNVERYKLFWKLHRVARDHWLDGQPKLRDELKAADTITASPASSPTGASSPPSRPLKAADTKCKDYLETKTLSNWAFVPTIVINSLPAVAAGLLCYVMRK